MNNIISINKLNFSYNGINLFKDFSLNIEEGNWVTITGPNGSGKTTLVKLLANLISSDSIFYYGIKNKKRDIGILFEDHNHNFITDTVRDEILLSLNNSSLPESKIEEKIEDITDLLKIEHLLDRNPNTLSGGELQRVAVASMLVYSPKILILDEALSLMNTKEKEEILQVIRRYRKENNMTIINFTNDLEESFGTNRLIVINKGKIILDGKPKEVMEKDTILNRIGVEIPFIIDLSSKLKLYGLVEDIYFDEDKLVNEIWK